MNSKTNDNIKKRETPNDVFYTPIDLVKIHLDYIKSYVDKNDKILDPFYGTGNYYKLFDKVFTNKNTFDYTEITMGKDFFEYSESCEVIVSNPPYSMIDKVLTKSIATGAHTISYLIGQNNLTNKRIEYMNNNGYYLDKMFFTKIYKWFGMSVIVVFTKKANKNCIDFDRTIWRTKDEATVAI
jgi:hypothetical protein